MRRVASVLLAGMVVLVSSSRAQNPPADSDFTVHEWGTFTTITGSEGKAISWRPLDATDDLPGFVEHFHNSPQTKGTLVATVRMETPVMYFYASQKMNVSVKVDFPNGLLTEWYPHASEVMPAVASPFTTGTISWNSITLDPSLAPNFPHEAAPSPYYDARTTSATPLCIAMGNGVETEKFLFYRGVSNFALPIAATIAANGEIAVRNLTARPISELILFERRGDKVGYRIADALGSEARLDPPQLTASVSSLADELRAVLVGQGLYPDEARAMVATWHDSWFEEGSRLIYVLSAPHVNSILPLNIKPDPANTVRVFVGRMELITPATKQAVETALKTQDDATLTKYERFLAPIFEDITLRSDKQDAAALGALFDSYLSREQRRTTALVQLP